MADHDQNAQHDSLASDGDELKDEAAVENPVDDTVIDGRMAGVPPNYERADATNPSSIEAEIQSGEKNGGA